MRTTFKLSTVCSLVLTGLLASAVDAGILYATREGTDLYDVDPSDADLTLVGSYPPSGDGEAIAFRPGNGTLYRWSGNGTIFASTIDPANGFTESSVSSIGTTFNEIYSATWDPIRNNFFLTTALSGWRTMDVAASYSIPHLLDHGLTDVRGVAFIGSTLYGLEQSGSFDGEVVDLLTLDPTTGNILSNVDIDVSGFTGDGAFGLAYDPDTDTLYAALGDSGSNTDRFLAAISPTTGVGTRVGNFAVEGINSLTLIPVPEPTTLTLLAGAMLMVRRRR